jgi:uncharacterized protein (DUF305 family)
MRTMSSIALAAALFAAPAFAQQDADHEQHHPPGSSTAPAPAQAAPAAGAQSGSGSPSPASPSSASPSGPGMMQMMMRKMPENCQAAMKSMPAACMSMMGKMMQGGMMGGAMMGGGMMGGKPGAAAASGAADHSAHGGTAGGAGAPASSAAHVSAFNDAIEKMHEPMMEGVRHDDPDIAFARGMIPHHQAAIDMALVVLKYGKDESMRKLAMDVIREQNREIAEMNEWIRQKSR